MILSFLLVAGVVATQPAALCDANFLGKELEQRAAVDQAARRAYLERKGSKDTEENVLKIDAANSAWLRQVLENCDWPAQSKIGTKAATNAWLIAQHSDMDPAFQRFAAEKMKASVLVGEASGKGLALLVDRNRRMQKQPQVYAMQFSIQDKMRIVFLLIEAPESLDQRRKEIGLEPFVCWLQPIHHLISCHSPRAAPFHSAKPYQFL